MSNPMEKKLLVVDSDVLSAHISKLLLENASFRVDTVSSAVQAIECLVKETYGAVITSLHLRDKNGIWLLDHLMKRAPRVVRVLHSASELANISDQMASGVVQFYVSKPTPNIGDFMRTIFDTSPEARKERDEVIGFLPSDHLPLKWMKRS